MEIFSQICTLRGNYVTSIQYLKSMLDVTEQSKSMLLYKKLSLLLQYAKLELKRNRWEQCQQFIKQFDNDYSSLESNDSSYLKILKIHYATILGDLYRKAPVDLEIELSLEDIENEEEEEDEEDDIVQQKYNIARKFYTKAEEDIRYLYEKDYLKSNNVLSIELLDLITGSSAKRTVSKTPSKTSAKNKTAKVKISYEVEHSESGNEVHSSLYYAIRLKKIKLYIAESEEVEIDARDLTKRLNVILKAKISDYAVEKVNF